MECSNCKIEMTLIKFFTFMDAVELAKVGKELEFSKEFECSQCKNNVKVK